MQTIAVNRLSPDSSVIAKVAAILHSGGVVAHPTETCYGFAVAVSQDNQRALERLYTLKKMDRAKPISLLVRDMEEAMQYGVLDDRVRAMVAAFWPGPLTVIVPRTPQVPAFLNPGCATIAMRVPSCPVSLALVRAVSAVTTTSANVSTLSSPYSVDSILQQFVDPRLQPDLILDGGVLPFVQSSTIIDTTQVPWKIVREGPISSIVLREFLETFLT